jgi:hypothetical protein
MPVLTTGPAGVTSLADRLVEDLGAGRVARQSFGTRAVAFEWAAGLPMILARVPGITSAVVDGLSFQVTRVTRSGTPAGKVAAGAPKPVGTQVANDSENLAKYAGLATFQTEQALTTAGLVPALAAVLTHDILLAYDADCGAVLDADNGLTASAADWPGAILGGIAEVASEGGAPGVLVLSPADYPAAVQSPGVGYAMNPVDGVPALWGLRIVLMSSLVAGTGYVLDPAAVMATENAISPTAVIDPYSQLDTNAVRCAVEAFLGWTVTSPGGVCQITKTP